MADAKDIISLPTVQRTDEAATSRDENDQLIVREKATIAMFDVKVTVDLDGHLVTIPKAVPMTDFLGNVLRDEDGRPRPRSSTIYDAARLLIKQGVWTEEELSKRIPVLCHRDHLDPIAVCRMCSVHVSKHSKRSNSLAPARVLVPACQHEVQNKMEITTRFGGAPDPQHSEATKNRGENAKFVGFAASVDKSVRLLGELLSADHLPAVDARRGRYVNELEAVTNSLAVPKPRPAIARDATNPNDRNIPKTVISDRAKLSLSLAVDGELPYSSRSIVVDHDRCILCDRCVRSCSDVKPFKVIGHTGKGYHTRISFDLDRIQNDSSCVQCGECMTTCPTGALTLKRRVAPKAFQDSRGHPYEIPADPDEPLPDNFLTAEEMLAVTLSYTDDDGQPRQFAPFRSIPFAYLKWNEGAVRRRCVPADTVLCHEGDYGSTAFFLKSGEYRIIDESSESKRGRRHREVLVTVGAQALVLGELACLANKPRTRSIETAGPAEFYEITRNILDMAMRSPAARDVFDRIYRRNALNTALRDNQLFSHFDDRKPADRQRKQEAVQFLASRGPEFRRVFPGESIVVEGQPAVDFYMIRKGFVKFVLNSSGKERVLNHSGANDSFGETALLSNDPAPKRGATAIAIDDVEVVRVPGKAFRDLCEAFPEIRASIDAKTAAYRNVKKKPLTFERDLQGEYIAQGLYQGQKLLVLDLESCTRCDECTRACADSHSGVNHFGGSVSRLLREGQRFGDFLVATSCRSCHKPYCMEGCPVDAIHRKGDKLEVIIDNHCIGCGLCEANCPYGAIQMVKKSPESEKSQATVARKAVNCDLCHDLVPQGADPFCVAACPHDAAFRMTGPQLLQRVAAQ